MAFILDWLDRSLPAEKMPGPAQGLAAWFEPARELDEVYVYVDGGTGSFTGRVQLLRHAFGPVQDRGSTTDEI